MSIAPKGEHFCNLETIFLSVQEGSPNLTPSRAPEQAPWSAIGRADRTNFGDSYVLQRKNKRNASIPDPDYTGTADLHVAARYAL